MTTFIENVNEYIKERNIKNKYISYMTDWSNAKVSRILNKKTPINDHDKEILADALGETVAFFMDSTIADMKIQPSISSQFAFSAADLSKEDQLTAEYISEMFRYFNSLTTM